MEESYIVRVFQRGEGDTLIGLVECPREGWQRPFHSTGELVHLLAGSRAPSEG
jgi:hypothetical protein